MFLGDETAALSIEQPAQTPDDLGESSFIMFMLPVLFRMPWFVCIWTDRIAPGGQTTAQLNEAPSAPPVHATTPSEYRLFVIIQARC